MYDDDKSEFKVPNAPYLERVFVFVDFGINPYYNITVPSLLQDGGKYYIEIIETKSKKDANIIANVINRYVDTLVNFDFEIEDAIVRKTKNKYHVTRKSSEQALAKYADEATANKLAKGINTYIKHVETSRRLSREELKYRMGYEYYKKKNKELEWDLDSAKQFEYDHRGCCCGGDD